MLYQSCINHLEVQERINNLREKIKKKRFSDLSDQHGRQYVDVVMQGGGMLGYSLVGYLYAIEQVGIRVLGMAGTSAGAIIALLHACQPDYQQAKSPFVLEALAALDYQTMVDGKKRVQSFLRGLVNNAGRVSLLWNGSFLVSQVLNKLGLNPGRSFYNWLAEWIAKKGVKTLADLEQIRANLPTLFLPDGSIISYEQLRSRTQFALIAADITTETKVVFPRMAGLYWQNPQKVNPASFVRASMSIPFVFVPFVVKDIPQDATAQKKWLEMTDYRGLIPKKVFFADGGVVSNFPINIFHQSKRVPLKPTFGIKLDEPHNKANNITSPLRYLQAIFNSSRHALDKEFINQNKDYRKLIAYINTGVHSWMNFEMTEQAKVDLFLRGVRAAEQFLLQFDWNAYKEMRTLDMKFD